MKVINSSNKVKTLVFNLLTKNFCKLILFQFKILIIRFIVNLAISKRNFIYKYIGIDFFNNIYKKNSQFFLLQNY